MGCMWFNDRYGRRGRILGGVLLLAISGLISPAQSREECPPARLPPVSVPHLRRAVSEGTEVVIVAIGSSSTQGVMATSRARSYPAVLQAELAKALPDTHIAILNRGIGGQDAAEEAPRLESDVIMARPSLVIWQVGANGVMRRTDPAIFKRLVAAGVRKLQAAGVDVILMDNQRAPAILNSPDHAKIAQALAEVAVETEASLFSRNTLMDEWERDGHPPSLFVSADGLHHNDRGYHCVATALSAAILDGLRSRSSPLTAAARR